MKRDCGTTMWCPNPDCQCSNGLTGKQQDNGVDCPQFCPGSRQAKKNIMSVGKEMDMRSTALPKLLKKLLKRNKYSDDLRSESPQSYTEEVPPQEQQQLEVEPQVESEEEWEYPTGYREYELQPEEEYSHLPHSICCCKQRQRETSEASSQADCPKHKKRKCGRCAQKSSLKCKGKVKFNKQLCVRNITDDELECCSKACEEAPSGRTRSSKCRVLRAMWEADKSCSNERCLAEKCYRRSKGGADNVLPSHYPTKWTQ